MSEHDIPDRVENPRTSASEKELQQLFYIVSHDFRSPIRNIAGHAELLRRHLDGAMDDRAQECMRNMMSGVHRLRAMLDVMTLRRRLDNANHPFQDIDATILVEKAIASLGPAAEDAKITVAPLPVVRCEPAQVVQVFTALLDNSLKFRCDPCEIRIWTESAEGGMHRFCVEDNGIGIPPSDPDRPFELFQRLHTEQEYPGLGAGLSLAKRIIQRHHGEINIARRQNTSESGTIVRFSLPVASPR